MKLITALGLLIFATAPATAQAPALHLQQPADELRIQRPVHVPQTFEPPEKATVALLAPAVFCPVLLCHGTCNHREGPCTLRTFDNLLTAAGTGCCANNSAPSHDQCGSHECCE